MKSNEYPSLYAVDNSSVFLCMKIKGTLKDSFEEAGKGLGQLISSSIIE
jgi:hypothetical protein